jgi:NAD+ synthase/NAD+ synthase (glutamine-hydrolysing)
MRIALAQINPTVGDIEGNSRRIVEQIESAAARRAQLVVFPELCIFGYPPKDLVLRGDMVRRNVAALEHIASRCTGIAAVVGYVRPDPEGAGKGVSNAAALCCNGGLAASYSKMLLPTYDVFDESRYFDAGQEVCTALLEADGRSVRLGLTICEDLWNDHQFEGRRVYGMDPIQRTVGGGAELLVNLSASPYRAGKHQEREAIFAEQVRVLSTPLIYVNQVGGNDDLIFDGASMVLDASGRVVARAKAFTEDLVLVDFEHDAERPRPAARPIGREGRDQALTWEPRSSTLQPYPRELDGIHQALVLGLRDYIRKCGFQHVVLGLSGGIDSALAAVLAVEAVGSDNVCGVAMPSRFSSGHSVEDAQELAANLGIRLLCIPIEPVHLAMERAVLPHFHGVPPGVAEENLQARLRGNVLMALSNKHHWMLITTGNKSELAVGYCTLYGDMCGGVAVLADVPKTVVYQLARLVNQHPPVPCRPSGGPLIPQRTLAKPPSAELRENQLDQDTLPPYDVLDAILERYVERSMSPSAIIAEGFDADVVERVVRMVDANEYKRKQSPVGLKVTSLAFGTGRRMPIAARFHA